MPDMNQFNQGYSMGTSSTIDQEMGVRRREEERRRQEQQDRDWRDAAERLRIEKLQAEQECANRARAAEAESQRRKQTAAAMTSTSSPAKKSASPKSGTAQVRKDGDGMQGFAAVLTIGTFLFIFFKTYSEAQDNFGVAVILAGIGAAIAYKLAKVIAMILFVAVVIVILAAISEDANAVPLVGNGVMMQQHNLSQ
jgi:hypothetical protein